MRCVRLARGTARSSRNEGCVLLEVHYYDPA